VPGNDYEGWLNALGAKGALQHHYRGNMVRPVDLENGPWKLKAVIQTDPRAFVKYDLPSSINVRVRRVCS
jgi:hypothetical protein